MQAEAAPTPGEWKRLVGFPTRWTTALSSKVNLPHANDLRAVCGLNLVTSPPYRRLKWLAQAEAAPTPGEWKSLVGFDKYRNEFL